MTKNLIQINHAEPKDIAGMVFLSSKKRDFYEKAQPQFWKRAPQADQVQTNYFHELLENNLYLSYVAKHNDRVVGFVIGKLIPAPAVYDPGGLTLMIDDFCVQDDRWSEIGTLLITHLKKEAKMHDASQIVIVCGAHDEAKASFLKELNLSIASNWYVGKLS